MVEGLRWQRGVDEAEEYLEPLRAPSAPVNELRAMMYR